MKKIVLMSLVVSSLFAVEMTVKRNDVVVNINTQEFHFKKGDIQELSEGSTICFISGKGKVVIPELKKQLKKPNRCFMIPISESTASNYAADIKNKLTVAFWDSAESVRHGAGTKGETKYESAEPFVVTSEQKELIIYGKEFGPLPVTAKLINQEGKEVLVFENDDSETTIFHINKDFLKDGMKLEIYNGFEELMVRKKLTLEHN